MPDYAILEHVCWTLAPENIMCEHGNDVLMLGSAIFMPIDGEIVPENRFGLRE